MIPMFLVILYGKAETEIISFYRTDYYTPFFEKNDSLPNLETENLALISGLDILFLCIFLRCSYAT